ncbi:MAG: TonB-dependent receptor [Pyrinomonadaceae bacterium]
MKRILIAAGLLFGLVLTSFAQSTTGRLVGVVSGPDGVLPNATVTAKDSKTGKVQTVVSKDDGAFTFPQLDFGTYTVTITASGFKTYIANEVKVDVGREYTLASTLQIGDVSASVTVTAGEDVITSSTAQVSNTVSPQQILSLPLITRNPIELIKLQAGTTSNTFQQTTINGMRTTFTNITRDGINIQDAFVRTNATDFAPGRPLVDDTGEFTISTSNQESDSGYGGAQVRLVTPRGTKNFHGALFEYNRNSGFAANNFFNNRSSDPALNKKPPFRNRNQYGGKISGPLPLPNFGEGGPMFLKNKGYFFFATEFIKDPVTQFSPRTILTPSARTGAFQYNRTTLGSPINSGGVSCPSGAAGSVCTISSILGFGGQPTSIDPTIQSRIISLMPTASNVTGGDGLNTAGYAFNARFDEDRPTYTTRIDLDLDEKNSINGVFSYTKDATLRPDAVAAGYTTIPGINFFSENKTLSMGYRHVFNNNVFNEFRFGNFRSYVPFFRTEATPSYFLALPLISNPDTNFLDQGRRINNYTYADDVAWVVGRHSIRFGGQIQKFAVNAYNLGGIVPTYTVGTGTNTPQFSAALFPGGINNTQLGTANGLLALLGGIVNAGAQSFNTADATSGFQAIQRFQPFRFSNDSLYVQDHWSAARGLTINFGLRYDLFPALKLANGLALEPVLDPNNVNQSLLNQSGTYNVIGTNSGVKNSYYKTDYNNFAPSVGVAYTPLFKSGIGRFLFGDGKTVLRGGYSQAYGNDSIVTSINNAAAGNVGLGTTGANALQNGTTSLNARLSGVLPVISAPTFITPPRTYLQNNSPAVAGNFGTVFGTNPKLQVPMVEQYSFGIQREFFGNTALEIRYVGSRSNNLVRGIDLNQIDIFNNGFLADFKRAAANLALPGATTAFCNPATVAGCQALTIFQSGTGAAGRLGVGTGGLSTTTFNNNLLNGTPADLAISFITNGLNNHPTVASPTNTPFVKFLANPSTGAIDFMINDASYHYDSLQVEVRRRFSQGLYLQGNYTFSKNLTNAVGTGSTLFEPYLDNNNKALDRQRADYDDTHVFNFNGIYQLPFGKGKRFLNGGGAVDKLFGGWEISGLVSATSGAPITFVDNRGTLNRTGRSGRQTPVTSLTNAQIKALVGHFEANGKIYYVNPSILNGNGQASAGFGSTPFNGQVFFNVAPGQTGNMARSVIDGPRYFNINAALLKSIRFGETMRLQLRAEAFNLLNNTNYSPDAQFKSITSTTFGQLTAAFPSREFQFAARFEF